MVRWRTNDVQNGVVRVDAKQLSSLIRQEPISKFYDVEQPPFAVGAFASVCRAQHQQTAGMFAAKFCERRRSGLDSTCEIHHEIALLSLCSPSPRIVRLHDVFQTADQFIIIMEYAPGGDMQTIIDNNIVPFEADVVRFVQHVVEGLSYLHHRRIAHLDIKPQNLVLMGDFPHCDVKVCDFEISRVILDGSDIHEILGTPEYVAPEILHYEPITLAADMWSLGVTVYVLLTGFSPFGGETDQETFLNISRAQLDFPEELFDDVSENAKDFIRKLLKRNPKDRMTAKQCLRHPWLASNKSRRCRSGKATATSCSNNQLRKYLSKSREALFERVVAKHQQMSHGKSHAATGNKSRYDRTRRLCESQMSLVSRSREQLLLTGNKRCLSRDKLYGIRHLSKSHEVLNSLAGALVAQLDGEGGDKLSEKQTDTKNATASDTSEVTPTTSSLQTVLTLICDSGKNNNNDEKEQTKENGSNTSGTNSSQPKPIPTGSTPETESKVLIAIEKLQQAMNNNQNKQEKDKNKTHSNENKTTNNPTKTAEQRKTSNTTSTADDHNKTSKTADQCENSTNPPPTADQNKTFATPKTADPNRLSKRFTVSKTADQNKLTKSEDHNKISTCSTTVDQNKISPTTTDQNRSFSTSKTSDQNKTSTTADQYKIPTIPLTITDQNKTLTTNKSVVDQDKRSDSCKVSITYTTPGIKVSEHNLKKSQSPPPSDQSKMAAEHSLKTPSTADQSKTAAADVTSSLKRPSRLQLTKQTSTQSADQLSSPLVSPTTDLSSSEADVSELDSSSQQSTWQRHDADEEPRFTVAQLVSAFNKHQALVTKTSLEVTMNIRDGDPESKILPEEISNHTTNRKFPIGPDALRLFIPGIKLAEHNLKKSPPSTPTTDSLETSEKSSPVCENIDKISKNIDKVTEIDQIGAQKVRKISTTADKSSKLSDKPTLDCSLANPTEFSPPTPPPPPPAPSSGESRNYKDFVTRPPTRHRTSGRQATTLAASSKIRKKSNATPKPPPFYS